MDLPFTASGFSCSSRLGSLSGKFSFKLALNQFVLVELGSTQKSPARSSTEIYIPLEVAAVETKNYPQRIQFTSENPLNLIKSTTENPPVSARAIEDSATRNDDGIEQVIADDVDTSLYPRVLVCQKMADTNKGDTPQIPECDVSTTENPPVSA